MENEKIKREKRILKISIGGTIAFVLAEIICAAVTGSMALLMDCVYDGTDLVMAIPFLILIPKLYKPLTERRPYGYSQIESFFLLIKYSALLLLTLMLVKESVETILSGGNPVSAGAIAVFELCVSAGCLVMMLLVRGLAKDNLTPTLKAELFLWKLSALSTLGVGIAFIVNLFLAHSGLVWICPYVDPAVAIICAAFLLKEPVQMIIESIRNLILFAPKAEISDKVEEIAKAICDKYGFEATFCEVIKTGRRLWINVYYYPKSEYADFTEKAKFGDDTELETIADGGAKITVVDASVIPGNSVNLDQLNAMDKELEKALEDEFEDVWLEMIMDLLEYRREE